MEAIRFDWDGTLVDSLGPLYRANLAVMRTFGRSYDEATYRATYEPDWRRMYGKPARKLGGLRTKRRGPQWRRCASCWA